MPKSCYKFFHVNLAISIAVLLLFALPLYAQSKSLNQVRKPIPQSEPPEILEKTGVPFDFRRSPMFQESGFRVQEWNRVMLFENRAPTFDQEIIHTDDQELAAEWKRLYSKLSYAPLETKLRYVNRLFNLWHYQEDSKNYGKNDYWASPREFIAKSGDCEDYAIIKYFALRALGVPAKDMSIVVLHAAETNSGHAVLVVEDYAGFYVLDNNSDAIVPRNRALGYYIPEFYINEEGIWKHH